MKCEVCLKQLEEYLDGVLIEAEAQQIGAHLAACAGCANELDLLTAEQEIYARYDRGLEITPSLWNGIAARTTAQQTVISSPFSLRDWINGLFAGPAWAASLVGAMAIVVVAVVIGIVYLKTHSRQPQREATVVAPKTVQPAAPKIVRGTIAAPSAPEFLAKAPVTGPLKSVRKVKSTAAERVPAVSRSDGDVLFSDVAYSAAEEQDTVKHIEQAQNLLRSVRNLQVSDDDGEIDVTYEKGLSRRLLNENIVLRRDAEMSGKFPVKTLLSSLEPFLIDIANLPDKTTAEDLRVIKERVQQTEIVAALHSY